jgi:hypothetical protein
MFDIAKGIYLYMHTDIRTEVTGVSRPLPRISPHTSWRDHVP